MAIETERTPGLSKPLFKAFKSCNTIWVHSDLQLHDFVKITGDSDPGERGGLSRCCKIQDRQEDKKPINLTNSWATRKEDSLSVCELRWGPLISLFIPYKHPSAS